MFEHLLDSSTFLITVSVSVVSGGGSGGDLDMPQVFLMTLVRLQLFERLYHLYLCLQEFHQINSGVIGIPVISLIAIAI